MNPYRNYAKTYRDELRTNVIPFWLKHAPDGEYGGFFTCLDRDGSVYDTEKHMWMQWRVVWMLSELHRKLEPDPVWLAQARQGFDFLTRYGKAADGSYYFSLGRDGTPFTAPYNIFSECFACMGSAAFFKASGDPQAAEEAKASYRRYIARGADPKGQWEKRLPGAPRWQPLSIPMIRINLSLVMAECLGDAGALEDAAEVAREVLARFRHPGSGLIFENIPAQGGFDLRSPTGRHLNPGHALESMWFVMLAARRSGQPDLISQAADVILATLESGWDQEHGGLYYFMDAEGRPHPELTWSMKLWWVHCEALIAALMAFQLSGRKEFWVWFEKLHHWTWQHYPDPAYGEWFGYLERNGRPASMLKGGKWKSFFHLPRMLLLCSEMLGELASGAEPQQNPIRPA